MTDFTKIVEFSKSLDQLNGVNIRPGMYEIQWPNGDITTEKLVVDEHYENNVFYHLAYFEMKIHGWITWVKAVGLPVRPV